MRKNKEQQEGNAESQSVWVRAAGFSWIMGKGLQRKRWGAYRTDEGFNHAHIWDEMVLGRGRSQCKGPNIGCLGEKHVT